MVDLLNQLTLLVGRHTDAAFVIPSPVGNARSPYGRLGLEVLDAVGVVGLTTPRVRPESHLLRPLVHLKYGDVSDVVIFDSAVLGPAVLVKLTEMFAATDVRCWYVLDTSDGRLPPGRHHAAEAVEMLAWATHHTVPLTVREALRIWAARPVRNRCPQPGSDWWGTGPAFDEPLPAGCGDHRRVECFLGAVRRALTLGHTTPTQARATLLAWASHPAAEVSDRWALTAADRDFLVPGEDALAYTHPAAQRARIGDVAEDGSTVTIDGLDHPVHEQMRPALARLRASRVLAGCPEKAMIRGLFSSSVTTPRRRSR